MGTGLAEDRAHHVGGAADDDDFDLKAVFFEHFFVRRRKVASSTTYCRLGKAHLYHARVRCQSGPEKHNAAIGTPTSVTKLCLNRFMATTFLLTELHLAEATRRIDFLSRSASTLDVF